MIFEPVGILGGMGPKATILLQERLMRAVPSVLDDADHVPLIIDMNPQVPSRISHIIEKKGLSPGPILAKMAKRLEIAGAQSVAMPCNTAHYYSQDITSAIKIPFINMIKISAEKATEFSKKSAPIGILGSPAVQMTALFESALAPLGRETLWPSKSDKLIEAIRIIKQGGSFGLARKILSEASSWLLDQGAITQLIACSEFSIISKAIPKDVVAIDTITVLAEEIYNKSTTKALINPAGK